MLARMVFFFAFFHCRRMCVRVVSGGVECMDGRAKPNVAVRSLLSSRFLAGVCLFVCLCVCVLCFVVFLCRVLTCVVD